MHGWLGSHLVLADHPEQVYWGDDAGTYLRTLLVHRDLLTNLAPPRPLEPRHLNGNYEVFTQNLNFLGFHNVNTEKLSNYVYDWRLGASEASCGLNGHLDRVAEGTAIVAHSFGGLVALYAIASGSIAPANLRKLTKVIVIATPYLGTTFALLGLSKSGDFLRRAGEFLPPLLKAMFVLMSRTPDFLTERLAPTFGSFQSLYDMIPHDLDQDDLRILKVPQLPDPVTSQNWPFWTATPNAEAMHREARRIQQVVRDCD